MKGVILGIAPGAHIVDITHDIRPFDVAEGAFTIAQAYRYFPRGTVHVVVVDPGVGTARRPILAEAAGQYFIAPDNGVLSMIYEAEKHKVRAITNTKLFLKDVSKTFHGRDVFAPSAAHVVKGVPPARFGKPIVDYWQSMVLKPQRTSKRVWSGTILKVDRFGNMITNFHIDEFDALRTRPFELHVGVEIATRLAGTFGELKSGELALIAGSSGYLEVAVNQGSAAKRLGCEAGASVELTVW